MMENPGKDPWWCFFNNFVVCGTKVAEVVSRATVNRVEDF